jgi:hypothetical protein
VKVQTYDVVVQLGGSRDHEVVIYGATPAEIELLRHIHGVDAVPRGWARKEVEIDRSEIEDVLIGRYGEDVVRAAFPAGVPELAKARRLKIVPERERWSDEGEGEAAEEEAEGDLPAVVKAAGAEVLRAL